MGAYILKRLLQTLLLMFLISLVVFLMLRMIPGDPALVLLGDTAKPEDIERRRVQGGLDKPLYAQFLHFLGNAVRGNMGDSLTWSVPATEIVAARLPATVQLAVAATLLAIVISLPLGIISAIKPHGLFDGFSTTLSIFLQSIPTFWFGLMLILIFAVRLRWFPSFGSGSWKHLVLPGISLSILFIPILTRLTRSTLLEVLSQDYMRTARSKGLPERLVILRHALRNAMIPVITIIGLQFGALLGGAVITEAVFAWPGVGRLSIEALFNRDYPIVQTTVLMLAVAFAIINLIVDITYGFLDPRIRYD